MSAITDPNSPRRMLVKTMLSTLISWLLVGLLVFGGAGRLDWGLGWLFVILWGGLKMVLLLALYRLDPALLVERATRHANTASYERWIIPLYLLLSFLTILVAAVDGGRLGWSGVVPVWVIVAAYIIYLIGNGLAGWAAGSNPFFSSESRLQSERGQAVVRRGPYRFVRHPAYLAAILLWPVSGLLLASWWAVIPGMLAALLMFIRTVYEDRMLLAELEGYSDYAREVRWRLFPGVW